MTLRRWGLAAVISTALSNFITIGAIAACCWSIVHSSPVRADTFTFTTLTDPDATGRTDPLGINNQGQIAGTYGGDLGPHGFIYSGGTFTTIDVPGSNGTVASGINNSGQIVGSYIVNTVGVGQVQHGFLYDDASFTSIDVPGADGVVG